MCSSDHIHSPWELDQHTFFPNPFRLSVMVQKLRGNPELMGLSGKGLEAYEMYSDENTQILVNITKIC